VGVYVNANPITVNDPPSCQISYGLHIPMYGDNPVVIIVQKKFGQKYPLAFNHTVLFDDY